MKLRPSYVIALGFLAVIGLWLLSGQFSDHPSAPPPGPARQATAAPLLPEVRVRTQTATERVTTIIINGHTEASRAVALRAQTTGRVAEIGAREGEVVAEGDLIVRLGLDDREARLAQAEADVARRRLEFTAATTLSEKAFASEMRLAEARAALEEAQAELAEIRLSIEHTTLRAPFAGILEERNVEIGDYLAVGSEVATIIDLTPVVAVGDVTEQQVGSVERGSGAEIRLATGLVREGRITYVARSARPNTRTFTVKVEIANADRAIPDGATAELRLPARTVEAHLVSPAVLTLDDAGRIGVKTVDADDVVHFHPVTIVADDPEGVWLAGLPHEATVITVGQEYVRDGDKVRPVAESAVAKR